MNDTHAAVCNLGNYSLDHFFGTHAVFRWTRNSGKSKLSPGNICENQACTKVRESLECQAHTILELQPNTACILNIVNVFSIAPYYKTDQHFRNLHLNREALMLEKGMLLSLKKQWILAHLNSVGKTLGIICAYQPTSLQRKDI